MTNHRLWFIMTILCSSVGTILSSKERCDMCTCQVVESVLLINCSDTKTRPGDNLGMIWQPYPESYTHYTYKNVTAYFERNSIMKLVRLSLTDVISLSLAQNKISDIDSGTFTRLKTLKTLSLNNNELKTLQEKSFQGLTKLEILDLSQNMLTYLSSGVFTDLKSLKTLSLSHNMIEIIEGKTFAIPTLQTLDLSFNSIAEIGLNVFENMRNLKTLQLTNNNIPAIDNYVFVSLASLETLDLSFNKITIVGTNTFSSLKSLKWLSLSWNQLEEVIKDTKLPVALEVLYLVRSNLVDLGDIVRNLTLQELHVQENNLQNIKVNGERLRVLNMSMNSMKSFPVLGYAALEVLDLSENQLSAVPEGLTGLQVPALRWLSLDNNPMREIRFPTAGQEEKDGEIFVNLTYVSVSYMSQLEELEAGAFSGLASPCGECSNDEEKEEIGEEFEALRQTCSRRLAVRVAHNPRLVKTDVDAFKDVAMCSLDLSYNALSSLDDRVTHWETLQAADLQGNPWDCTCSLQWVLDRVVPLVYNTNPELLYELRCNRPIALRNKRLVHFYNWKKGALCSKMEQLRVEPEPHDVNVTFGSSGSMLAVVGTLATLGIILVVVGIVLQKRHDKKTRKRNRRF